MKRITDIILISVLLLLAACSDEQTAERMLSAAQAELIGRGVDFDASHADEFVTRTTYRHNGSFNEGDIMYIYRQYSENAGISFDRITQSYRVYILRTPYIEGTSFALDDDEWVPLKGAWGYNPVTGDYPVGKRGKFQQEEGDSLTWENGKTVRFRAWSRSNLAGAYAATSKWRYYPDYCVSEWVTVSGPTLAVPLTLKHQGCRIGFVSKAGNEFQSAEICTEWEDYKRLDNADNATFKGDDNIYDTSPSESGKTDEEAKAEAALVKAVYEKMCMPAGVDTENALLSAMTQELYSNTSDFTDIHTKTATDGIVTINTKNAEYIKNSVQRPVFNGLDGRLYMITIPYDMSTATTHGETLKLPACTRFRIWLYDINDGDKVQTTDKEATYHIFTLGDVVDKDGKKLFENGLELKPGYSYLFTVGYHYDHFTITPADNFSWDEQDAAEGTAKSDVKPLPTNDKPYEWWKDAIHKAIPKTNTERYNPEFHIDKEAEFIEFIHLVNGTAVNDYVKAHPLTRMLNPTETFEQNNVPKPDEYEYFRWYYTSQCDANGNLKPGTNPADSLTHDEAKALGYVFYDHYHSANADQAAYTSEDYLQSPYSFYDANLSRHFTVCLDADLDLKDWELPTIGMDANHRFRGIFDGCQEIKEGDVVKSIVIHTLKNVYFKDAYMFGYCYDAAIRNLKIETTHPFMLLNTAEAAESAGYGAYIVGISIYAPSTVNPIARVLKGSSYVVGCLYEGSASGAMVGEADNLNMYGNMMAATGLPKNTGALLGKYTNSANPFFAPQGGTKVTWGRFMCNYYLMDHYNSDATDIVHAVGDIADDYRPQEYIRGGLSWVLKAKNDNMLDSKVPYERLTSELMRKGYYGLAPWKVMNYAIYEYNLVGAQVSESHNCKGYFVNDATGYAHVYPHMVAGELKQGATAAGGVDYATIKFLQLNN